MKRIFSILSLALLLSFSANAQLGLAKIGISAGGDVEKPHGMDLHYLLSTANGADFNAEGISLGEGEIQGMQCDNGSSRLTIALAPPLTDNVEWRVSLFGMSDRIDQVNYKNAATNESLIVKATSNEVGLEGVYLRKNRLAKWITVYGGAGINTGYSYGGKVQVTYQRVESPAVVLPNDVPSAPEKIIETVDVYDQKNGVAQRVFLQGGFGIHFLKRMEFSIEFRKGLGYRANFGGPFNFTTMKQSSLIGIKYSLF
ncbi:MAG TPA: hypothetical protein ENJ95_12695 [Bacteroidetes bacterium]|nr:hypothetical protein [Bacteroidota bacterium]